MKNRPGPPWIDISVPLKDGMAHWPGDPAFGIRRVKSIARGDLANLSEISMGAHSGTHVDAPFHFISTGKGIDELPLETLVGRVRVIEIRDPESIKADELRASRLRRGERILFKTRNSPRVWQGNEFVKDFVSVSAGAAQLLVDCGVRAVGIDYLSVGSYGGGGSEIHKILLGGGVWIIEGLDMSKVAPGKYDLVCLPLKLVGSDGAPARAMIRPLAPGRAAPRGK